MMTILKIINLVFHHVRLIGSDGLNTCIVGCSWGWDCVDLGILLFVIFMIWVLRHTNYFCISYIRLLRFFLFAFLIILLLQQCTIRLFFTVLCSGMLYFGTYNLLAYYFLKIVYFYNGRKYSRPRQPWLWARKYTPST